MAVEEQFFEAFNIPKRFYTIVNFGDLDNNYQEASANTLQELFEENSFWFDNYIEDIKDFHDWEEKYPPITSDIVLGLITILSGVMPVTFAFERSVEETKEKALNFAINYKKKNINHFYDIDDQVRALFNAR